MNIFDLSDEMRIKLLKIIIGVQILTAGSLVYSNYQLKKSLKQSRKLRLIQSNMIEELVKGVNDPEILKKTMEKYEFDWIVFRNDLEP